MLSLIADREEDMIAVRLQRSRGHRDRAPCSFGEGEAGAGNEKHKGEKSFAPGTDPFRSLMPAQLGNWAYTYGAEKRVGDTRRLACESCSEHEMGRPR